MIDYEQKVQAIINSIITFSFEFDIEALKKEMELQEVSKEELEKLGEEKVKGNFNSGKFKIKLPNGSLIDFNSIAKHSDENNIKEPVIYINPNFKYVQWVMKKNFTNVQIKRHIKSLLTNNTDLSFTEVQKALINEDTKDSKVEGYIGELVIKTSNIINEGKFHIQSTCSTKSAIKMVNQVIEELKVESKPYIKSKIRRDYKYIIIYLVFIVFVTSLWFVNKQVKTIPLWLSNVVGIFLFLVSLIIMRLINHSFFNTMFFKGKVEKKYEKEFYNNIN